MDRAKRINTKYLKKLALQPFIQGGIFRWYSNFENI